MKNKLPFIVTVPHGGTLIPEEIKQEVILSRHDQFFDSDAFTREIFALKDMVSHNPIFLFARAYVDAGRAPAALPPEFPDGVIKSKTCYEKQIYRNLFLSREIMETLILNYYQPFHEEINRIIDSGKVVFGFDCHSMAETAPPIAPDAGMVRPLINLGNRDNNTSSAECIQMLAGCFKQIFDIPDHEISINKPFKGGYITRKYGNNPVPWIQIEINRSLYLKSPWFDEETLKMDHQRIVWLNERVGEVLECFYRQMHPC